MSNKKREHSLNSFNIKIIDSKKDIAQAFIVKQKN